MLSPAGVFLVCAFLCASSVESWAQVQKPKPPPGLSVTTAGKSGVTPVRRRRRKCAPENRAQCHGQEVGPIVASGAAADLVLGQPDFTSSAPPAEGVSARTIGMPMYLGTDEGGRVLLVPDMTYNRVQVFDPLPTASFAPATRVVGQPSFTDASARPTPSGLSGAAAAMQVGGKLVVSDSGNSVIAVYAGGTTPALVLGRNGLHECSAIGFAGPYGLWTDGTRLAVADGHGNRVLVWRTFPTTNGQPADLVLGQPDMTTCAAGSGLFQMSAPLGVFSDGTDLYVADGANRRVLVFRSFAAKANGAAADLVLGKQGAAAADTMFTPQSVLVYDGALFVSDMGFGRVMVWDTLPTVNGQPATHVLGRPTLTSAETNVPVSATTMRGPVGMVVTGDKLWIADRGAGRVLRFTLYP